MLCLLYLITLTGTLGSTGYRFPFNQSLLSTAIDNIKEDSWLFSSSSLATLSKAAVKSSHRVVPVGTTHLCMLHVRAPQDSASVLLPLLSGLEVGSWQFFFFFFFFFASTSSGQILGQVVESLLQKGAIELAPLPSLGYYSRLFIVMKASGSWRPVMVLSLLNLIVLRIHHPEGCVSVTSNTSGMQIVSSVHGVRRSLPIQGSLIFFSPWLRWSSRGSWHLAIQASSREQVLLSLRTVLRLFNSLGIVVNWEKSQLMSHQKTFYLGVLLDSVSSWAYPAQKRFNHLLSIGSLFLSCMDQPAKPWLELIEMLSSLTLLIPRVRLRMQSFQFALHQAWDHLGPKAFVRWSSEIHQDFFWWLDRERRELVISPEQVSSQLDLWSNSSDVGWGSAPRRGGSFQPLVSRGAAQLHPSSRSLNNFLCVCAGRSAIPSLFCLSSSWGTTPCWRIFSLVSIQFWVPSGSWHC